MKNLYLIFLILLLTDCSQSKKNDNHSHHSSTSSANTSNNNLSPHTFSMKMINGAHIHIDYSSPSVRNRIIFGGLLAFDEVWQSGAHNATWIETDYDLKINDKLLKMGKYGFFTIPSKDEWIIIFNSNWDQHGKDEYDEKDDVLRFAVTPETLEENVERLRYEVNEIGDGIGEISLLWEKTKVSFQFKIVV